MPVLQVEGRCVPFVELMEDEHPDGISLRRANLVTVSPDGRIRIETNLIDHWGRAREAVEVTDRGYTPTVLAQQLNDLAGGHAIYSEDSSQLSLLVELFKKAEMRWSWKWKPIGALYVDCLPDHSVAFLSAREAVQEVALEHAAPGASLVRQAAIYSIARAIEDVIGSKRIFDLCAELYREWAGMFARQAAEALRPLLSGTSAVGQHGREAPRRGRAFHAVENLAERMATTVSAPLRS